MTPQPDPSSTVEARREMQMAARSRMGLVSRRLVEMSGIIREATAPGLGSASALAYHGELRDMAVDLQACAALLADSVAAEPSGRPS